MCFRYNYWWTFVSSKIVLPALNMVWWNRFYIFWWAHLCQIWYTQWYIDAGAVAILIHIKVWSVHWIWSRWLRLYKCNYSQNIVSGRPANRTGIQGICICITHHSKWRTHTTANTCTLQRLLHICNYNLSPAACRPLCTCRAWSCTVTALLANTPCS